MGAQTGTVLEDDGSVPGGSGRPKIIQLRVHGVGGATPEGLLGLPLGAEVVRVAGDESAGVYARPKEPHVEAYVWSKLTRSAWAQALWIILLPFTLFNVANWMYPQWKDRRWALVWSRALMFLLGLSLTVSYLLWESLLSQQVFYEWGLGEGVAKASEWGWVRALLPPSLESTKGLGYVLSVLALILVNGTFYYVARRTREDFEDVTGPVMVRGSATEPPPAALGFPVLKKKDDLGSGHFWGRTSESTRLLWLHVLVEIGFLVFFAIWSFPQAEEREPGLGLSPAFLWTTRAQVFLIVLLLIVFVAARLGKVQRGVRRFRFAGPVVVATLSLVVTVGPFAGLAAFLATKTKLPRAVSLDLTPAFGGASLAFLGSTAIWAFLHWRWRRKEWDPLIKEGARCNSASPGEEPNGFRPRLFRKIALYRSFAKSVPRLDTVMTATAIVFIGSVALLVSPWGQFRFPDWIGAFGAWLVGIAVTVLLPVLVYRSFKVSARAKVGIIWDVLTFWPRRFHPFAVRPYAERAVPELEWRIFHHLEAGNPVIVCAHSQGSVLAYAALTELGRHYPKLAANVALVTFGAPLRTLYASFFPAYFGPDGFGDLRRRLARVKRRPSVAWRNFFRRTDYVGQDLFDPAELPDCDVLIHDPPRDPPYGQINPKGSIDVSADPPQAAWTRAMVHSYYNNSPELRKWVDRELPASVPAWEWPRK